MTLTSRLVFKNSDYLRDDEIFKLSIVLIYETRRRFTQDLDQLQNKADLIFDE